MGTSQSVNDRWELASTISLNNFNGRFFSIHCWLAMIMIMLLVACDIDETSQPVERAEIVGRYRATYLDSASEYIILNDDGTYEHQYHPQGDSILTQTGTWKMRTPKMLTPHGMGSPRISFRNFINWYPMVDSYYYDNKRGTVDSTPRGWGPYIKKNKEGVIKIERCPTERQYYILEKSADSVKNKNMGRN